MGEIPHHRQDEQAGFALRMGAAVGENLRDAHRSTPHWLATLGRDVKHYQASLSALQGIRERYQAAATDAHLHGQEAPPATRASAEPARCPMTLLWRTLGVNCEPRAQLAAPL